MNNTLYLEKKGCDFFYGDEIEKVSDLNNYRYYVHDIELKNGINCNTIEIGYGARYKTINDKIKYLDGFGLWISTYYRDADGVCWGLREIDEKLNKRNFDAKTIYTQAEVLKSINRISKNKYTKIVIIESY